MSAPVGRLLLALNVAPPYRMLDVLERHLAEDIGAHLVQLWLSDYEEASLRLLVLDGPASNELVEVEGTALGRAYRSQQLVLDDVDDVGDGSGVLVPVTLRAERIGVLRVALAEPPTAAVEDVLAGVGVTLAHVMLAARRYTDAFELPRRRRELELPAELQWELLPVLAHTGPDFGVAGSLEPAYDIGGDSFDYAVDADGLTVLLSDAMGHGLEAALLSTLVVGAARNARRRGLSLRQQVRAVNTSVVDTFRGEVFATGFYLHIDRRSGEGTAVNAGHSLAYVVRGGRAEPLMVPPDVPVGLFADAEFVSHTIRLRPGDRLVLYSDGVVEAAREDGEVFGPARLERHLCETSDRTPAETVRLLTAAVSKFGASFLADDVTALCIDYRR